VLCDTEVKILQNWQYSHPASPNALKYEKLV